MSKTRDSTAAWQPVLEQMFTELRSGAPRAEGYWAQQLAFGPVLIHAVSLALHRGTIAPADQELLRKLFPLAMALLGALPDDCDGDPHSLRLLARRQAEVLAWGRRRHLQRVGARVGAELPSSPYEPVPRRLRRAYELIGWRPPVLGSQTAGG